SQRRINLHPNACGTPPHFAVTHPQKKKVRLSLMRPPPNGKIQGRVAVSADIKEMFLRVKIREEDRDSLRSCGEITRNENPQEYRMTSLISAPPHRLVPRSTSKIATPEFELEYPEACKAIRLDHYVDDFLKSFNSRGSQRVSKQVYEIHRKAAFELRGWASNEIEVLNEMPDTRNDDNVQLGATHELKTLTKQGHQ
ncbi:hypothetical protein EVAR_18438_1, partial [Eumeta japonica]